MPVYGPRDDRDLATPNKVVLTGGAVRSHNAIILDPHDRTPNRGWKDINQKRLPVGWGIYLPPDRAATKFYVSRPGNATFAGASASELEPPRRDTMTDQTPVPLNVGKNWVNYRELLFGYQPEFMEERHSRLPRPQDGPVLSAFDSGERGLPAGTYGVRIDLRVGPGPHGRTTPSGFTNVTLGTGQGIKIYVPPEAIVGGANFMGVYVTRPGSGGVAGTEREQAVKDIRHLDADNAVIVDGPYDDNGSRPATVDLSGLGRLPAPLKHLRHGRAFIDPGRANWNLHSGRYQFGYVVDNGRGLGRVSDLTKPKVVQSTRENTAIWFRWYGLPDDWRVIPIVYFEPLGGGTGAYYAMQDVSAPAEAERGYGAAALRHGVPIYGPLGEKAPSSIQHRLVEYTPSSEDLTGIPIPDEAAGPDAVASGFTLIDAPADYLVATADVDEIDRETRLSPTNKVTLASVGQGIRAVPYTRGNRLRNPEGSQRTGSGKVVAWNIPAATATSNASFQEGSLRIIGTGVGTAVQPISDPVKIPDQDTDVSVKVQMRLGRVGTSASQVFVRFYQKNGTTQVGSDVVVVQANTVGQISTGDQGTLFGPNGTAIPDGASQIAIGFKSNGSSWNSAAYVENMAIFFYPTALRKFESKGPDEPVVFNPSAPQNQTRSGIATGYPQGSTWAIGAVDASEEDAPANFGLIEVVDFEGGSWPGSGATAWATGPFTNNGNDTVISNNQIFGAFSVQHNSQNTDSVRRHRRRRTYTNTEVGGSAVDRLHVRIYERWEVRTDAGEIWRCQLNDQNGLVMASVYESAHALRLYWHDAAGQRLNYSVGLDGLRDGQDVDFELGVFGDSDSGQITLAAGSNGNPRRKVASRTNRDFTNRRPRQVEVGYEQTSAAASNFDKMDNIIVSRNGAPLYYETPDPSTGTTIPSPVPGPEAPPDGAGGYRLHDALGDAINQWWFWVEPGVQRSPDTKYGPYTKDVIAVAPGEQITHAIQGCWTFHEEAEIPSHQFFVVLHGPGLEDLRVGSPFAAGRDAATVSRVGGGRSNRTAAQGMAASASITNANDFYQVFTVPEGYLWATIEPRYGVGGYYAFQEHLFAKGSLTTQSERDAERDFQRETSGSATVYIEAAPRLNPYGWPQLAERISMAVEPGGGENSSVSNVLYASAPERTGPWSSTSNNPTLVPENTWYRFTFDMAGEAEYEGDTPRVRADSMYVLMKPRLSMLLREDRTEIFGAIFVDGVDVPDNRARTNVMEIDGDVYAPRTSKRVRYLTKPLTVHVSSQAQKRLLERQRPDSVLLIESPELSSTGRLMAIRPGVAITVDTNNRTAYVAGNRRRVYGTAVIPAAQVIEFGPLLPPSAT